MLATIDVVKSEMNRRRLEATTAAVLAYRTFVQAQAVGKPLTTTDKKYIDGQDAMHLLQISESVFEQHLEIAKRMHDNAGFEARFEQERDRLNDAIVFEGKEKVRSEAEAREHNRKAVEANGIKETMKATMKELTEVRRAYPLLFSADLELASKSTKIGPTIGDIAMRIAERAAI